MRLLTLAAAFYLTTGCASVPPHPAPVPTRPLPAVRESTPGPAARSSTIAPATPIPSVSRTTTTAQTLRAVELARGLRGSPYRLGGNGPAAFDCSGFTRHVFRSLGIELPRIAEYQADTGRWVAPDELQAGDLVFFGESRQKPFHVGIVTSPAGAPLTMIHASTSRGVIETNVTASDYWIQRFTFGRRILR